MRKLFTLLLFTGLLAADVPAAQAPTIGITFSCTPAGAACTEFLRLVSDGMGYAGVGTRMAFVQTQALKYLYRIGRDQKKGEDAKTATTGAESTYNAAYPEPPE